MFTVSVQELLLWIEKQVNLGGNEESFYLLLDIVGGITHKEVNCLRFGSRQTIKLKEKIQKGASLNEILPEAFALVREASLRSRGERHFDVQIIGGVVLHENKIAEMRTGEGKTLTIALAAYLNALKGKGVHIVTVNDYLAKKRFIRDG